MSHGSLSALEEAHDDEAAAARCLIDEAEERLHVYRSRMNAMHESSYRFAAHLGVAEHSGFREALQRVVEATDEHVREGSRTILELDEGFQTLQAQHREQREEFLRTQ